MVTDKTVGDEYVFYVNVGTKEFPLLESYLVYAMNAEQARQNMFYTCPKLNSVNIVGWFLKSHLLRYVEVLKKGIDATQST
jgi:hypothetical protein